MHVEEEAGFRFGEDQDILRFIIELCREGDMIFPIDVRPRVFPGNSVRVVYDGTESAPQELGAELVQEFRSARGFAGRADDVDGCVFVNFHTQRFFHR